MNSVKKYALNYHLTSETDELYKKTTVCIVLTDCPIFLLKLMSKNLFVRKYLDDKRLAVHSVI